jgi:hypothetical protein
MSLVADTVPSFVEAAAKVSSGWSLAAFAIAGVLAVVTVVAGKGRRGPVPAIAWAAVGVIALLGLVPVLAGAYVSSQPEAPGVYRLRATVVDARNVPVDDARVWSDVGGEWQQTAGGWEVTVPDATLPASRRLVVRSERASAFERAVDSVTLGSDHNPTLTLRLRADTTAMVRGTVVDVQDRAVANARVYVEGYGAEGVVTDSTGSFVLPAHAAEGQSVPLWAEKPGVGTVYLNHPAGRGPARLQLKRAAPR